MNTPLIINDQITISSDQLEISAVRSSGPGGQNVNKVATCIELRFNPELCPQLSIPVVQRLLKIAGKRVDSQQTIIVTSQRLREQSRNLEDARNKLKEMILKALKPPKPRKATKPTKASIENRINKKKLTGNKKSMRRKPDWSD